MKKLSVLISFIFLLNSCQNDDICPAATQTTPNLLIEFYDTQNRSQLKPLNNFNAWVEGVDGRIFQQNQDGTSISVPLRTDSNTTQFAFTLNANTTNEDNEEEDEENDFMSNTDTLTISYGVNEIYVNRACGYKVEFLEFTANYLEESEGTNWIEDIQVQQPNTIRNEESAHLYIYF